MCGLFGIAGIGIQSQDLNVFRDLMIFNMVRGIDGTGIAFGNTRTSKRGLVKVAGDAQYLSFQLDASTEKDIYNWYNTYLMGHTRWMTVGKVSKESAQPFAFDKITGAHNGTISADYGDFHSDSEFLLSRINERGFDKAIEDILIEDDAFTLTWVDHKTKLLHFASNGKRPLGFAIHKHRQVLYWSSELEILRAALSRRGISSDSCNFFYMSQNLHLSFNLTELTDKEGKATYKGSKFEPNYTPKPKKSLGTTNGYKDWWGAVNPLTGEYEFDYDNGHGHGYNRSSYGS